MPNHVHGIVIRNKSPRDVEAQNFASLHAIAENPDRRSVNQFCPQSQNLASIVRGFKIGVTKYARQHQISFDWQPRYHDHIIRNTEEHDRIRKYIIENPQNWSADCFYDSQ